MRSTDRILQPVAVLGYKFWQRHFNGDASVVGKTIQLNRKNYTIVGVAGSRFTWGDGDVYLPLKITGDQAKSYYAGVRLKPGVTHAQANAALQPLIRQFFKETPTNFPQELRNSTWSGLTRISSSSLAERSICSSGRLRCCC